MLACCIRCCGNKSSKDPPPRFRNCTQIWTDDLKCDFCVPLWALAGISRSHANFLLSSHCCFPGGCQTHKSLYTSWLWLLLSRVGLYPVLQGRLTSLTLLHVPRPPCVARPSTPVTILPTLCWHCYRQLQRRLLMCLTAPPRDLHLQALVWCLCPQAPQIMTTSYDSCTSGLPCNSCADRPSGQVVYCASRFPTSASCVPSDGSTIQWTFLVA